MEKLPWSNNLIKVTDKKKGNWRWKIWKGNNLKLGGIHTHYHQEQWSLAKFSFSVKCPCWRLKAQKGSWQKEQSSLFLKDGKWKWKRRKQLVWPYERKGKFSIPLGWWYEYPPLWGIASFFFPFISLFCIWMMQVRIMWLANQNNVLVTAEHYYYI